MLKEIPAGVGNRRLATLNAEHFDAVNGGIVLLNSAAASKVSQLE